VNIGIIGYGTMGRIRHENIRKFPGYVVTSVCDPKEIEPLEEVQVVSDYREIIEDPDIGCVFLCVPNHLTMKYVTEALDNGKHVFSEKPPGVNTDEVLQMIEAEKRNLGCKLMFGFNHRYHDSVIKAKELIDSGEYGNLLWMRGRYGKSVSPDFGSNWRSKKKYAGGGIFLDQGIHMLDLFLLMCGDFTEVRAYVSNLYWKSDIEDNVFALFRNDKGQVASLHSTMTQWRHLFSMEMFLERGYITINGLLTTSGSYGKEKMTIARNRTAPPAATWSSEENLTFTINYSWENEIRVFFECLEKDLEIMSSNTQDALKLMRLVDKVYAQK
jgi:predicted dehydrogenase